MMYGHGCGDSIPAVLYCMSFELHTEKISSTEYLNLCVSVYRQVTGDNLILMEIPVECCPSGYLMNEKLACVIRPTITASSIVAKKVGEGEFKCLNNESLVADRYMTMDNDSYVTFSVEDMSCVADTLNGTKIIAKCVNQNHSPILGIGEIVFWGAQTYIPTNLAHMILCFVVVLVYLSVPELGRGLYNRAVVRHNISLLMQGVILQLLACCALQGCQITDHVLIFLWLVLQYFTIATVFWLNTICFDMTLAIIRFRWIAGDGVQCGEVEARKLMMYSIFAWSGPLLPTLLAGLCDYIPQVPKDFLLKPNYVNYMKGPSTIVSMYFFFLPMLVLLLNNILFICTTYKIIKIQRSTKIATRNQKNILTKKYFLFLRLYLLMGAPWFFGMLLACFNHLILLKICRMIQPLLWLLMLTTHKELVKKVRGFFMKCKHRRKEEDSLPPTEMSSHL